MKKETKQKLEHTVGHLGKTYRSWKENEKYKDSLRTDFFAEITQAVREEGLATMVAQVEAPSAIAAMETLQKQYPTWLVGEIKRISKDPAIFEAILEGNPKLQPYTFEHEGWIYGREVVRGQPMIDDERLQETDPELWEEVTEVIPSKRQLRDLSTLPDEAFSKLSKYLFYGAPKVKLSPPKQVKDE